jgi:predicted solute-binding protein
MTRLNQSRSRRPPGTDISAEQIDYLLSKTAVTADKIDDLLSKAARKALIDITERRYHDIVDQGAEGIIDLGLAVHGANGRVEAIFDQI